MSVPSIKKNFLYSSILTTANYIFPMLTFPYVTRILGATNFGICNYVDSIIQYFLLFSIFGIGVVGVREVAKAKNEPDKLSSAFSSLIVINLVTTAIALVILFFCVLYVPLFQQYRSLMWVGAIKILFNFLLVEWFFKGIENFKYITKRSITVRCVYVVCVFLFVKEADDYDIYYFLSCLMIVVNALFNIIYSRRFVRFKLTGLNFKPYIGPMLIIGLYSLLTSMYTTFNTMYLGVVAGETEVGYYSVATKFYRIIIALFSAFTGVMLPRMSSLLSERRINEFKHLLSRSVSVLFSFSIPLVIFCMVFAREIVTIVVGDGFEGAVVPMIICMPLIIIIGYEQIIIIQGLMPLEKNKAVFINSIFGAVFGVICCVLLMKPLKSIGAAITWILSEIVVLISASVFIKKYINVRFPFRQLIKNIVYYLPMAMILCLLQFFNINVWLRIILALIISGVYVMIVQICLIKEPLVMSLLDKVRNKAD